MQVAKLPVVTLEDALWKPLPQCFFVFFFKGLGGYFLVRVSGIVVFL